MAAPDSQKQGLFKKHLIQPFRTSKPKVKAIAAVAPSKAPVAGRKHKSLASYEYSSLNPNTKSVRLLEVLPGPDFEPIKVKISPCDLDDNPSYIALSYMWDQVGEKRQIDCQGTGVAVGENLWQFLQQYRRKISTQQYNEPNPIDPSPLWIDAICINQRDIEERSHQVSQMRDIYTGAESVIVWLGLARSSEELAFLLTRFPNLLNVTDFSTALVEFLNMRYWSRVWVVQEFVLAKSVEIWCSTFQADAAAFESLWRDEQLMMGSSALSQQLINSQGWPLFKYRRDFRHSRKYKRDVLGRRNSKSLKSTFRLRDLLQSFASSQSSEAYDKVYGFLGIASTERGRDRIRPDYKKQSVELLVDVLHNQCYNTTRKADEDNHKFLTFLTRTLGVSRMELAKHLLQNSSDEQKHIYIFAVSGFMNASVSFLSTISDIGTFVDHAEAFQESSWKTTWGKAYMHPKQLSGHDIQQLRPVVFSEETANALSFADQHVPDSVYRGKSEEIRHDVIAESTDIVIRGLIKPRLEQQEDRRVSSNQISDTSLKKKFSRSMAHGGELHLAARDARFSADNNLRYERYATFVGTNGIIGLACIGGGAGTREIAVGDRICVFSDTTESSYAFIVRLDYTGKWIIAGFAVILFPAIEPRAAESPRLVQRTDTEATMISEDSMGLTRSQSLETNKMMCFHCHLTDLLELSRCRILNPMQMERLLEQSLRGEPDDEVHRCTLSTGTHDILEFGL